MSTQFNIREGNTTINGSNLRLNDKHPIEEFHPTIDQTKPSETVSVEFKTDNDTIHITPANTDFNIMHKTKQSAKQAEYKSNTYLNSVISKSMNDEK